MHGALCKRVQHSLGALFLNMCGIGAHQVYGAGLRSKTMLP